MGEVAIKNSGSEGENQKWIQLHKLPPTDTWLRTLCVYQQIAHFRSVQVEYLRSIYILICPLQSSSPPVEEYLLTGSRPRGLDGN